MFKPLNSRVLIEPEPVSKETSFGLVLANGKEKPLIGTIVVGGKLAKKGDRVLFTKFAFDECEIDGKTLYVVSEDNLLGIFN